MMPLRVNLKRIGHGSSFLSQCVLARRRCANLHRLVPGVFFDRAGAALPGIPTRIPSPAVPGHSLVLQVRLPSHKDSWGLGQDSIGACRVCCQLCRCTVSRRFDASTHRDIRGA